MKTEQIESLSKDQLINVAKEHINRSQELEKKLGDCLDTDHRVIVQDEAILRGMLVNIAAGALRPVIYRTKEAADGRHVRHWETMQHTFWGLRNLLLEHEAFSSYWSDANFRLAIITVSLAIEHLPGNPSKEGEQGEDFDYNQSSEYFVTNSEKEFRGFVMISAAVKEIMKMDEEVYSRWDLDLDQLVLLRVALGTITDCQRIWLNREIQPATE